MTQGDHIIKNSSPAWLTTHQSSSTAYGQTTGGEAPPAAGLLRLSLPPIVGDYSDKCLGGPYEFSFQNFLRLVLLTSRLP